MSDPDGFILPSGKRVLSSEDVTHLVYNRKTVSEVIDQLHRVFGMECFRIVLRTPLQEFDNAIYKYLPEFTFTHDEHIMTGINRLLGILKTYPTCKEVKDSDAIIFQAWQRLKGNNDGKL